MFEIKVRSKLDMVRYF